MPKMGGMGKLYDVSCLLSVVGSDVQRFRVQGFRGSGLRVRVAVGGNVIIRGLIYNVLNYFCGMGETFPYHYRAYGLNVASEIPVTGFEPSEEKAPDVVIKLGTVPENLENIVNRGVLFQSNDHEFLIHVDAVARYYICNGNTIIIQKNSGASDTSVSTFLTGTSFGALLHQRRLLPLHASTIIFENKCLMFMGISGAGKSTLASAYLKKGATLVADDISVVNFSGQKPAVTPAFPTIKIWKDSLKHLGIPHEKLVPVREELEKYYFPVDKYSKVCVP